jgi:hypothetical protein
MQNATSHARITTHCAPRSDGSDVRHALYVIRTTAAPRNARAPSCRDSSNLMRFVAHGRMTRVGVACMRASPRKMTASVTIGVLRNA